MKRLLLAALLGALATPAFAQGTGGDAAEYQHCSITPVDQVGFVETFKAPAECATACQETEGCDSWTFRPHSFDKSMPGQCKLIAGVFSEEESTSTFCGKI